MNNSTQALQQTIHNYCLQTLQTSDFTKNQQVLDQLKNFLLDWNNIQIFRAIMEQDLKAETTFVLYQLLQKSVAQGCTFVNILPSNRRQSMSFEDFENNEKEQYTLVVTTHIDIALNYLGKCQNHPNYVLNTVLFALAYILRKYWSEVQYVDQQVEKLINTFYCTPNLTIIQMGFKFFENLLSCVKQYFYATGYLEFRKVMMGFQRQSLQTLLSQSHQLISNQLLGRSFIQMYQQDQHYLDSLISLLHSFMTFNFNLSFYEIDIDNDLKENFVVNFPEFYFPVISDQKLTQEYFIAAVALYQVDQNLSLKLIAIIQRIASLRLSIFFGKKHSKKLVRRSLWDGLLLLLQNQQLYINNNDYCNEVCSFAIRLVSNFTLRKLGKFTEVFEQCVSLLNQQNQYILNKCGVKISLNNIFVKMQEVWHQLTFQLNLQKPNLMGQNQLVSNSVKMNFLLFLHSFYNGNPFSEIPPNYPVKKIKKFLEKNFSLCVQVYQQNTQECVQVLGDFLIKLPILQIQSIPPQEQLIVLQKFSSVLCLISALVLSPTQNELLTGHDYYGQQQKQEKSPQVAKLISMILDIISFANKINIPANNDILKLYHTSVLIFIQTYISQTIENLIFENATKVVVSQSQLYTCLVKDNLIVPNYLIIIERLLEECFQIFTLGNPELVEYSFIILQFTYEKLKRQLERRFFRQCSVNSMLKQFIMQMDLTCFNQIQYIKKRKQIYKIIALVWVDDQLDDYIPSLVDIYKQIKQSITIETNKINMLKYIWDMIGVVDQLEVDSIYRVYLRIVYPDLSNFLSTENANTFVQDYDSQIGLTSLIGTIFRNKNTRLSNENIQIILYQIYGKAIHFFITSIDYLLQQVVLSIQSGIQLKDSFLKMGAKLLQVMGQISASKQINQGFFIIYQDNMYLELLKKQFQLITAFRPCFQNLTKYKKSLYECLEGICTEHSETLAYRCGPEMYIELLIICENTLKDILVFKQPKGEEQINEEVQQLQQIGNILVNVMQFLIQEGSVGEVADTSMIKNKIFEILKQGKQVLMQIFQQAFMITMAYPKQLKFQSIMADIMFSISLCNPKEFQQYLVQLIQDYKGSLTLPSNVLEPLTQGYQVLESCLNPATKENYTKKIRFVLENLCNKDQ